MQPLPLDVLGEQPPHYKQDDMLQRALAFGGWVGVSQPLLSNQDPTRRLRGILRGDASYLGD